MIKVLVSTVDYNDTNVCNFSHDWELSHLFFYLNLIKVLGGKYYYQLEIEAIWNL